MNQYKNEKKYKILSFVNLIIFLYIEVSISFQSRGFYIFNTENSRKKNEKKRNACSFSFDLNFQSSTTTVTYLFSLGDATSADVKVFHRHATVPGYVMPGK